MFKSRWIQQFENHPIQSSWTALHGSLDAIELGAESDPSFVSEAARLKKVVEFVGEKLRLLDPELLPRDVLANMQSQVDACTSQLRVFQSNKNIGHLQQANNHGDALLQHAAQLVSVSNSSMELSEAANEYSKVVRKWINKFPEEVRTLIAEIKTERQESATQLAALRKHKTKIEAFFKDIFEGTADTASTESRIQDALAQATANTKQINDFHTALVVGTPDTQSTQAKVKVAAGEIETIQERAEKLLGGLESQVNELGRFHEKIFGEKDAQGHPINGLEYELTTRTQELQRLEYEQKTKHLALSAQIESLLPGATSAGLATAYKNLKDSFERPIKQYTLLFYGSLLILVIGAILGVVHSINFWPLAIQLVDVPTWDGIFKALLYKSPFIAPVIWLALFSSKRRSQYERLQQEYAHKEALASSYESYKKQLQDLKQDQEPLQRELLSKAIDTIGYNASTTLDGRHDDKLPLQELLAKLNTEDIAKVLDKLRSREPKSA